MMWLYRWKVRCRILFHHADELNRRVEVENVLLNVAKGKRPPPTPEECRMLAYKLGMPNESK